MGLLEKFGRMVSPTHYANLDRFRMENEALREEMREKKKRRGAMNQLGSLLQPNTAGPGIAATPQMMDQRMDSLLFQAAPEAVTEGLLAQRMGTQKQPRTSAAYNDLTALYGRPPTEKEFMEYQSKKGLDPKLELEISNLMLENQRMLEEMRSKSSSRDIDRQLKSANTEWMLNDVSLLKDALETIQGTALQSGVGFTDIRRLVGGGLNAARELLGEDVSDTELNKLVRAVDDFSKGSNRLIARKVRQVYGDSPTNAQVEQVRSFMPSLELHGEANMGILEQQEQELRREAEIYGVELGEREKDDPLRKVQPEMTPSGAIIMFGKPK